MDIMDDDDDQFLLNKFIQKTELPRSPPLNRNFNETPLSLIDMHNF